MCACLFVCACVYVPDLVLSHFPESIGQSALGAFLCVGSPFFCPMVLEVLHGWGCPVVVVTHQPLASHTLSWLFGVTVVLAQVPLGSLPHLFTHAVCNYPWGEWSSCGPCGTTMNQTRSRILPANETSKQGHWQGGVFWVWGSCLVWWELGPQFIVCWVVACLELRIL